MSEHEGACLCGAVRYRVKNEPVRNSACHCTFCQRRIGSAFGLGAYFRDEDIRITKFGWFRSAHPWIVPPPGMEVHERGTLPAKKN